jgi:hypothetical protein
MKIKKQNKTPQRKSNEEFLEFISKLHDKKLETIHDFSETKNPARIEKDKFLRSLAGLN